MDNLEKLEQLIPQYYEDKQNLDSIKKVTDAQNTEIKALMLDVGENEVTAGDIIAKRVVVTKESFNEDKLINLLDNSADENGVALSQALKIIKMKRYVDMDALEDALYKGLIPEEVIVKMNSCRDVKETVQLRVTKKKVKKNDD